MQNWHFLKTLSLCILLSLSGVEQSFADTRSNNFAIKDASKALSDLLLGTNNLKLEDSRTIASGSGLIAELATKDAQGLLQFIQASGKFATEEEQQTAHHWAQTNGLMAPQNGEGDPLAIWGLIALGALALLAAACDEPCKTQGSCPAGSSSGGGTSSSGDPGGSGSSTSGGW